jgi:hypothetical protein
MRWSAPLSSSLIVAIASTTLVASEMDPCAVSAQPYGHYPSSSAVSQAGQVGQSGQSGRAGRSGENVTVFATGQTVTLNLSGTPGENGTPARNGLNARCVANYRGLGQDYHAPSGGNGGTGGHGGAGGDGGNLTVYFKDPKELSSIFVQADGGRGGRGGLGGTGGLGCQCAFPSWSHRRCTMTKVDGKPVRECHLEHFQCFEGRNGMNGGNGTYGRDGSIGQLILIPQLTPLAADQPSESIPLNQLTQQPIVLSLNRWQTKSGARSLLAPGSIIADNYQEFTDRIERTVEFVWDSTSSRRNWGTAEMSVLLTRDDQLSVSFPSDLWVEGTQTRVGDRFTYTIGDAILQEDVTKLAVGGLSGSKRDLVLNLVDLGGSSEVLNTQFSVKYQTPDSTRPGLPTFKTRYQGEIPATLIQKQRNQYQLKLGQLPISPQALARVPVRIELVATRSFAGNTAQQTITWTGKL